MDGKTIEWHDARVRACVRACVCACVRACVCACVRVIKTRCVGRGCVDLIFCVCVTW